MRLKVEFECDELRIPINYQHLLQGVIYNIFDRDKYGQFLHDVGYRGDKRMFKLFTFSNLYGKYTIEQNMIVFNGKTYFYIGSQSEDFMRIVYDFFCMNKLINIYNKIVKVTKLEFSNLDYFNGIREIKIKTLSPVVAYRTENNYFTYFKPSQSEFEEICLQNINEKNISLDKMISDIQFKINNVNSEKKRLVKFKNTFYVSYLAEISINVNYDTLLLIYNTGLSSKGPSGFGMIEVIR